MTIHKHENQSTLDGIPSTSGASTGDVLAKAAAGGFEFASHNNITGLQGGTTNEYYHLTAKEHDRITSGVYMFGL